MSCKSGTPMMSETNRRNENCSTRWPTQRRPIPAAVVAAALAAVLGVAGCGPVDGPELGEVSGSVTLDGKIVQDALLEFIPASGEGSVGYGATDEEGQYCVKYTYSRDGALLGSNMVRITNGEDTVWGGEFIGLRQIFPARYNQKTELQRNVEAGENVFDFHLESGSGAE